MRSRPMRSVAASSRPTPERVPRGSPFTGTPAREAVRSAATAIGAAGSPTPRLDAELLVADALGVGRERLLIDDDLQVSGPAVRALQEAVRRRAQGREPIAYILGRRGFRGIELLLDGRVLVPRPETELLVEVGLGLAPGTRVLDVGTGSGAIALALKAERPDLDVLASDVSPEALAVARANAERLRLDVRLLEADLLAGLEGEPVEAVLSNPPYVAEGDRAALEPEIARHEPALALYAGPDGLDVLRRLVAQAAARVGVRLLAVEVGAGQADDVERLTAAAGFTTIRRERDLAGIERVVVAER